MMMSELVQSLIKKKNIQSAFASLVYIRSFIQQYFHAVFTGLEFLDFSDVFEYDVHLHSGT